MGSSLSGFISITMCGRDVCSQIIAIITSIIGIIALVLGILYIDEGAWTLIISGILSILAGGFLSYAAYKKQANFALFYLVLTFIRIIWDIILVIIFFIAYARDGYSEYLVGGIFYLFITGLVISFWIVVLSFYRQLRAQTKSGAVVHTVNV